MCIRDRTRTIQMLLAYLVLERSRLHPREVLADLFWGEYDEARARSCLNTALWRLRKALEPEVTPNGRYLVTSHTGEVGFNLDCDCWLDVAAFEERAALALRAPVERADPAQVRALEEGLALYTADLLEGVYEDWALTAREHARLLYLQGLDYLMRYYRRQGDPLQAIEHGQKILDKDPLREGVHRELMQLYDDSGQRSLAVRQYDTCRRLLLEELGIPPMEETRRLYDAIIGVEPPAAAIPAPNGKLKDILNELHLAHESLEQANRQYHQALRRLEEYTSLNH